MNEKDLSRIERSLKIILPKEYRDLMLAQGSELRESGCFDDDLSVFYVDPKGIVSVNKAERAKDSGTEEAFPKWWKTFFLVGTDGAGGYYCLRLDNRPGVWMIGSDCGDKPTRVARSLKVFVQRIWKEAKEEQERAATRDEVVGEELEALGEAVDPKAKEWLEAITLYPMFDLLDGLGHTVSPRKLRLFGLACCRRIEYLTDDADFAQAVRLAEKMVQGEASPEQAARLRARLEARCDALQGTEHWCIVAARDLLQDDEEYLREARHSGGDAALRRVWSGAYYAVGEPVGETTEFEAQTGLLREVLGNPFHPVRFEPQWRTAAVVELARTIYESQAFDRMPELAESLADAGCDDQQVLRHCRSHRGHVRGCWVLDMVLQSEPEPQEEEFTWDFTWQRSKIDAGKVKERIRSFGTDAPGGAKPEDDRDVLAFADWLEQNGDDAWAGYVRARCGLDGKLPGEDYPDLIEQYVESSDTMQPGFGRFEGFGPMSYETEYWWHDKEDGTEMGLPSHLQADGPGPADRLIKRLDALVRNSSVRGVDFQSYYAEEMAEILRSPGALHLRRMAFSNQHERGKTGPVIEALAASPLVRMLQRLTIDDGIQSDGDAEALARAPFERLRRLDVSAACGVFCSAKALGHLMSAPWFRNLEDLRTDFSDECCETAMLHLAGMKKLHSLALWKARDRQIGALGRVGELSALRRLVVHRGNLSGECGKAFARLKAPRLIELWLASCTAKADDLRTLVGAPLFRSLRVLSLAGPRPDEACLDLVAGSPCAPGLRILRLDCGDSSSAGRFRSLANTALTRPGVFPELTSLHIKHPYAKKAKRDTAEFLRQLATSKLRHLTLYGCGSENECQDAIAANPALASLSRLRVYAD